MANRGGIPPFSRRIIIEKIGRLGSPRRGGYFFSTAALKRTKKRTDAQNYAAQTMAVAARFVNLALPFEREQAKTLAGNSGWTWKDQLISNFFGTDFEIITKDGTSYVGRRILAADIQQLLDAISAVEGSILVRTESGWAALYPAAADYVLTMRNTGLPDCNRRKVAAAAAAQPMSATSIST